MMLGMIGYVFEHEHEHDGGYEARKNMNRISLSPSLPIDLFMQGDTSCFQGPDSISAVFRVPCLHK